jgi:hypothetical protein
MFTFICISQGGYPLGIPLPKGLHPSGHPKTVIGVGSGQGFFTPKREPIHSLLILGNYHSEIQSFDSRYLLEGSLRGASPLLLLISPSPLGKGIQGWGYHY